MRQLAAARQERSADGTAMCTLVASAVLIPRRVACRATAGRGAAQTEAKWRRGRRRGATPHFHSEDARGVARQVGAREFFGWFFSSCSASSLVQEDTA